jgi:hypothetical protein
MRGMGRPILAVSADRKSSSVILLEAEPCTQRERDLIVNPFTANERNPSNLVDGTLHTKR